MFNEDTTNITSEVAPVDQSRVMTSQYTCGKQNYFIKKNYFKQKRCYQSCSSYYYILCMQEFFYNPKSRCT